MPAVLPVVTDWNRFYWTSGSEGRLQCCAACGALQHPPAPICRYCSSDRLEVAEVCGRGVVHSHTTNYQQWSADFPAPYTVAVVAIDEDPRVRVTTNIMGCDPEQVYVGMRVRAVFDQTEDAGLAMSDIDGLSTYPAGTADGGYSEGGVTAVETALGVRPSWHNGGSETAGATGSLIAAFLAVASGLCRHVVCFVRSGSPHMPN